ncbi:MAG: hypothetical protein JWL69_551 [Phycisphaerales bacterium]|nr:hypothetical protein [Phycisphaerales bacterium]
MIEPQNPIGNRRDSLYALFFPSPGTPGEGQGGGSLDELSAGWFASPLPSPPPEYQGREQDPLPRPSRPRCGFTLLELLIALTISASMGAIMVASLGVAFKSRQAAERAVGPARTKEVAMEILRDDLQCALPPRGQFAGSFIGTNLQDDRGYDGDDLTFYTTTPSPFHTEGSNGEIKQIELTVYPLSGSKNKDYVLVRRIWNNLLAPVQENPDEEIICRHVMGFNLRYFDGTTSTWQDTWDSTQQSNALPLAVEVTLAIDTLQTNPDGSPRISQTVRVYPFPCTGKSNDTTSTSTSSSSTAGGGS